MTEHNIPRVSVVIPTHDRPELVASSVRSVLSQTYTDLELIVVDVGLKNRAKVALAEFFADPRFRYVEHPTELPGGAARNIGARLATGEYVAFQDDDDEWIPEKLAIQMTQFEKTGEEVGFCFSGATLQYSDHSYDCHVPEGVQDFHLQALTRFKGFLTVTQIIRKSVFDAVGGFNEKLPSHQDPELILRITKKWKGLGIDRPLVLVNQRDRGDSVGGNVYKRILGMEMVLAIHAEEFAPIPTILAKHYFQLGIFNRSIGKHTNSKEYFFKAFQLHPNPRYLAHFILATIRSSSRNLPSRSWRRE